jgi:hypothetical protein
MWILEMSGDGENWLEVDRQTVVGALRAGGVVRRFETAAVPIIASD